MSDRDATQDRIDAALGNVIPAGFDRNVVDLGWVAGTAHCDGAVRVTIQTPLPGDSARESVTEAARAAIQSGVPEASEIMIKTEFRAGSRVMDNPEDPLDNVSNVIAVASGKGGVGKSTIAVNLAAALARMGARVGVLDADVYGPSIPTMLGVKDARPVTVEGADGKKRIAPVESHGIRLMSMGFLVEQEKPVIWRGPMLHGALKQFFGDVAWGELDYLILDLPPGTGDVALTMAQSISLTGAVVVSTPQEVAMVDARKAVAMFDQTQIPILGVVENMTGEIFGEGHVRDWAEAAGHPFLGAVPLQVDIRTSGDLGIPAALSDNSELSSRIAELANGLALACARRHVEAPARPKISIER